MITAPAGGTPAAMTAGVSEEELAVMREAAASLGVPGPEAAGMFGALAVPFTPPAPDGRAENAQSDGMHWCI